MPKVGMEPVRRDALVRATIAEIGERGSLDVTVAQIARRAGMSSGLAHHYFGGKDDMLLAAMRHILTEYGEAVRAALKSAATPEQRLFALIDANIAPDQFAAPTVSAWLNFYVQALGSQQAARLLRIYQQRLRSNLRHALRPISDTPELGADAIAAMIDGVYLRQALTDQTGNAPALLHATAALFLRKAGGWA